jgi:hypothetical protein
MKNIHLVPTYKPSRLVLETINNNLFITTTYFKNDLMKHQNIYITNNSEIKEGDWYLIEFNGLKITQCTSTEELISIEARNDCKKIILTTDQDLIKDGIQEISEDFLQWFVKNPNCKFVKVENQYRVKSGTIQEHIDGIAGYGYYEYKIIIPKEEPKLDLEKEMFELEQELDIPSHLRWHNSKSKQETLEEAAEKQYSYASYEAFIRGAKWQQEQDKNKYSEEELKSAFKIGFNIGYGSPVSELDLKQQHCDRWFEQFKKK